MKENMLGIDVGGTKCAIIYGIKENDELHIIDKKKFDTTTVDETIAKIPVSYTHLTLPTKA